MTLSLWSPHSDWPLVETIFLQPRQWEGLVNYICNMAYFSVEQVMASMLVITPSSFAVCFIKAVDLFIILDSHSHGDRGGLVATVPKDRAALYFKEFINRHYCFLLFIRGSRAGGRGGTTPQ